MSLNASAHQSELTVHERIREVDQQEATSLEVRRKLATAGIEKPVQEAKSVAKHQTLL